MKAVTLILVIVIFLVMGGYLFTLETANIMQQIYVMMGWAALWLSIIAILAFSKFITE